MTLIEVLVALAIVGMLLASVSGVLEIVMRNKWIGEDKFTSQDSLKQSLELISSDMRGATELVEQKSVSDNKDSNDIFLISVITSDHLQQIDDNGFWHGPSNVYYQLRQDKESGFYNLMRMEVPFAARSHQHEYKYVVLTDILSCSFYAAADTGWLDTKQWQQQNSQKLPAALKVFIETINPSTNETYTIEQIVILSSGRQGHYKEKSGYAYQL